MTKNGVSMYQPDKPFASVTLEDCNGPGCPVVINADVYCAHATADETCISNALASVGSVNARIMLGARTYNFGSELQLTGLSNVAIEGTGPASIIRRDGMALECTNCSNVKVANLAFQTVTAPAVVAPAALPTANPATVVVIDRFSTGSGYIPTSNDGDIVAVADGGSCTVHCLSTAQSQEAFDTGLFFNVGNHLEVSGVTGSYFGLLFFDVSNVRVHDNFVAGGKGFLAGIGFWKVSAGSAGNHFVSVTNNKVQYAGNSGIAVSGGDHFLVTGNETSYNGESGIKTYQGGFEQAAFVNVSGNASSYNWFDGFDLSSNYPHTAAFSAHSTATGNRSDHNHQTGYYADGKYWTFVGNEGSFNGTHGAGLDFCDSTISSNVFTGNNTTASAGFHQMLVSGNVSCADNVVTSNSTDTQGNTGNGIYAGGISSVIVGNHEATGTNFIATGNFPALNSDSAGSSGPSLFFRDSGGDLALFGQVTGSTPKQMSINTSPSTDTISLQGYTAGVGFNQTIAINAAGGPVTVNARQVTTESGTPTVSHAVCWKTSGVSPTLGFCSTVADSSGACTCN